MGRTLLSAAFDFDLWCGESSRSRKIKIKSTNSGGRERPPPHGLESLAKSDAVPKGSTQDQNGGGRGRHRPHGLSSTLQDEPCRSFSFLQQAVGVGSLCQWQHLADDRAQMAFGDPRGKFFPCLHSSVRDSRRDRSATIRARLRLWHRAGSEHRPMDAGCPVAAPYTMTRPKSRRQRTLFMVCSPPNISNTASTPSPWVRSLMASS